MAYGTFETLQQQNAVLRGTVELNSGIQLAAWYNDLDRITVRSDHHTLSLYVADGYESYQKTPYGWKNGGGPDRFCLMPKGDESTWDIRGDLSFVHLYCTDEHLRRVGEQIWDRSPASFTLQEKTFASDDKITAVYRQFLLDNDWRQQANQPLKAQAGLEEIFTRARGRPVRTFPVAFPLLRLDRIYVKNAHASHPKALALKHWRHLSDHAPLSVEIHL